MEISLESIAVALADEGVPLRAIARVTRIRRPICASVYAMPRTSVTS
jgi:hypothetical protein